MKLTPHFTLAEFTASDTARQYGLDNTPTPAHLANLRATALGMEMVRLALGGRPITVTSAYRSPAVNAHPTVRGTPTSAHPMGHAGDFRVATMTAYEVARELLNRVAYDQLILETSRRIVHISFDPRLRMEAKTQRLGPGTPFVPGIVR